MPKVSPIPPGCHTITASLTIHGAAQAIELYKKAFGAEEITRTPDPSGKKVWHAQLKKIGDSMIFLNDDFPEQGSTPNQARLWIYADNIDNWFKRCVDAGFKPTMQMADMFWGDRMGMVTDPFGDQWTLAQHRKDLSPADMQKAQDAAVAEMNRAQKT